MTAIRTRLTQLEAATKPKKSGKTFVDEMRETLAGIDDQPDLGMQPGESLWDVTLRRVQVVDGWNLERMPGDSLEAKLLTADMVAHELLVVSDEVVHAARHWVNLYRGI